MRLTCRSRRKRAENNCYVNSRLREGQGIDGRSCSYRGVLGGFLKAEVMDHSYIAVRGKRTRAVDKAFVITVARAAGAP